MQVQKQYHQHFFTDLLEKHGIGLENLIYYKVRLEQDSLQLPWSGPHPLLRDDGHQGLVAGQEGPAE